jgi:hypothetical protein
VLHLEVGTFSYLELLTWVKRGLDCIWTAWRVNEVDWGPSLSTPNVLHQATTSPLAQEKKCEVQHVLEVQFGPQNCPNLQQSPRLHTESDWDVLALHRKLTKSTFEWIQPYPHIFSEWAAIVDLLQRPFCPHLF